MTTAEDIHRMQMLTLLEETERVNLERMEIIQQETAVVWATTYLFGLITGAAFMFAYLAP